MDFSPAAVASPPVENGHARARHGPTAVAPGLGATTTSRPVSALAEAESESKIEPGSCPAPIRPESLHPSLWLGHQLAQHADLGIATGFPALDAQLPGGGWPRRALTELLLPHPGIGELRLLAPSLVGTQHAGRLVMLFDPPAALSATALAQLGFEVDALLVVNTRTRVIPGADSLWALEQALKSGHVGAVLAWLPPRLRAERLRRLQLAAHTHDGPAFVMCDTGAAHRPTAAPLRLALRPAGADMLAVRVPKRRGSLLESPISIELPPVLSMTAQLRASGGAAREDDRRADAAAGRLRHGSGAPAAGLTAGLDAGSIAGTTSGSADGSAAGLTAATFINLAKG